MRKIFVSALGLCLIGPSLLEAQDITTNTPKTLWERDTLTGDWGGLRSRWSENGFDLGIEYTGEFLANTRGGLRRGGLYQGLLKTPLDFDLEKMAGWRGGHFHASSLWLWGTRQDDIAGMTGSAYSDPSNISGYDTYRLYELWLEQDFFDGKLSVKFGQLALDEEFLCNDYACVFLSGTHGWPTFMASTIPNGGPAYPVAGTGARLTVRPVEQLDLMAAVVDGDVRDQATGNRHGTHFGFDGNEGVLSMIEIVYRLNQKPDDKSLPGTYKLGGWYHSGHFEDLRRDNAGISLEDDGTLSGSVSTGTPASHRGNGGIYLDASQLIWRKQHGSDEGLGIYVRIAPWLLGDRNPLDFHAAGGLSFKGPLPNRGEDIFAVGMNYARVSKSLRGTQRDANRIAAAGGTPNNLSPGPLPDYELTVEATYRIAFAPWWSLQPDFQYIFHPGGSSAIQDAVVVGLRTQISF